MIHEDTLLEQTHQTFARLQQDCPIPDASYTIYNEPNISSSSLAYTTTWFFPGDPYYPAIQEPSYVGHDFEIAVNPHISWWIGSCELKPHGAYDLQTVLLHEILHGVGILSTIGPDKSTFPAIYDTSLRDNNNQPVVHGSLYTGSFGQTLHINHVNIYNPTTYTPGSSFSHYTHNGVMQPWQDSSTCIRHIDNDVKKLLRAIGYPCAVPTTNNNAGGSSFALIGIIIGAIIVLGLVAACFLQPKKTKGRRKRPIKEPLLVT